MTLVRRLFSALVLTMILGSQIAFAESAPRRIALVVGNGAYESNRLTNPPNDARDVAAALKDCGFNVTLLENADLAAFERAVNAFSAALPGADTGLFYYAGHGVQIDGSNYLIPVSPRIEDAPGVKARAIAVDTVVGKMEAAGVRTSLVFLDCCRDNPFPGSSRSGTRGLSVVAPPRTVNSLIAYATSPGDVAADGEGRNGVFSGAVLKYLREPGLELGRLMRQVKAEVASRTANRQQPRVDDGMKEAFYFISPEMVAEQARQASERAEAGLAELERQIADREKAIAAAGDARKKRDLETEQQKARALEAARRLEADNARKEAERAVTEARAKAAEDAERARMADVTAAQAANLKAQADEKRAAFDKLKRQDDRYSSFIEAIARLEAALADISARYADAGAKAEADVRAFYDAKTAELQKSAAEPWESETDFTTRISKEKNSLAAKRSEEIRVKKAALATEMAKGQQTLQQRVAQEESDLAAKRYTLEGTMMRLDFGTFDRDRKSWPVTLVSTDTALPYAGAFPLSIAGAADLKTAYTNLDTSIKSGALAGEVDFRIRRWPNHPVFLITVTETRIRDITSGKVVYKSSVSSGMYGVYLADPSKCVSLDKYPVKVGDIGPAGGTVFFDKGSFSDGWRYLEAAPADLASGVPWAVGKIQRTGTPAGFVGAGKANTDTIVARLGPGTYAAGICSDYICGGYDDWFLPSIDELGLLRDNLALQKIGGTWKELYWSSTEDPEDFRFEYAASKNLASDYDKFTYFTAKREGKTIRAIRMF